MRSTKAVAIVAFVLAITTAPAEASNDPHYGAQWSADRINAAEAWTRSTGRGIAIGIVDTGVDLDHEDLAGRVATHVSCVGGCGSGSGEDDSGHGTFVAGVAAASTGNGVGIAGVAPDATLVVAKVLNRRIEGQVDDITAGIRWVVDHGARVVNVSISDGGSATASAAPALRDALEYAWRRGAVPVVAAGNSDYGRTNALVVTGVKANGDLAPASGRLGTAKWGLAAPGGDPAVCSRRQDPTQCVISTSWARGSGNRYRTASGASTAVPHVAGVVAQLLAVGYDQQAAVERVLTTANRSRPCGKSCHGVVDAARALGVPAAEPVAAAAAPSLPPAVPSVALAATPAPIAMTSRARISIRLTNGLEPSEPMRLSGPLARPRP